MGVAQARGESHQLIGRTHATTIALTESFCSLSFPSGRTARIGHMSWFIGGLPLHPLIVHATVVFVPLSVLGALVVAGQRPPQASQGERSEYERDSIA